MRAVFKLSQTTRKILFSFGVLAIMTAAIIYGGRLTINMVIERVIIEQTKSIADHWARIFANDNAPVEDILKNKSLSRWQAEVAGSILTYGEIYSFAVFGSDGRLVYSSDYGVPEDKTGSPVDPNAVATIVQNSAVIDVLDRSSSPNQETIYTYVFAPLPLQDGYAGGAISLFLDKSDIALKMHNFLDWLALLIPLICAGFYVFPSAAFIFKYAQEKKKSQRVNSLSTFDQLTGVLNRHSLHERMVHPEKRDGLCAVLYVDLDMFKSINDEHGHGFGDAVLRHLGRILQTSVEPDDLVGRVGGDEFVVVLQNADSEKVEAVSRQIIEAVQIPFHHKGKSIQTSVSVGSRCLPYNERLIDALNKADLALYSAKSSGRNQVVEYYPELETKQNRRRFVEQRLRDTIKSDTLAMCFQPIHSARDHSLLGFEALVRMFEADGTPISPTEFIPIAEETGLIHDLSSYVLQAALRAASRWPNHLFVSVNLSPAQFKNGDLVDNVLEALRSYNFPAHRLELEVTEGLLIQSQDLAGLQLVGLRNLGVSIAMDDFGTGYSSIGYLWQYEFDKLKVDRSFIEGLEFDPTRYGPIIEMIVQLGHRLSMKVTVEGLENGSHIEALKHYDCDQYQGYVFSRPMPEEDVQMYLEERAEFRKRS